MVAITWVRRSARSAAQASRGHPRQPAGPTAPTARAAPSASDDAISSPTATNDSQNPACSSAHGSIAVTTTAATSSTSAHGQRRPLARASVTTASIQIVRCDGTPQPENSA